MDEHKRNIKGYRGKGSVCPCCRETTKREASRLARHRLKARDRKTFSEDPNHTGGAK